MKTSQRRVRRLAEGACPTCDEPLLRRDEFGVCECCWFAYRLRDGEVEIEIDGVWRKDSEHQGPRGCLGPAKVTFVTNSTHIYADSTHVYHLDAL